MRLTAACGSILRYYELIAKTLMALLLALLVVPGVPLPILEWWRERFNEGNPLIGSNMLKLFGKSFIVGGCRKTKLS